jgi:stage III sporulation protein AD
LEIVQIVVIGIVASILALTLKRQNPEISLAISIVAGVIIFMIVIPQLKVVLEMFYKISQNTKLDKVYIAIVLKIIGIAYISEFGVQICKDAGEGAIASKIELVGKILIMLVSAPILVALMDLIITIMP